MKPCARVPASWRNAMKSVYNFKNQLSPLQLRNRYQRPPKMMEDNLQNDTRGYKNIVRCIMDMNLKNWRTEVGRRAYNLKRSLRNEANNFIWLFIVIAVEFGFMMVMKPFILECLKEPEPPPTMMEYLMNLPYEWYTFLSNLFKS